VTHASAIMLFILDEAGKLIVNTTEGPKALKAGHKLAALVDPVEPAEPATEESQA